MATVTTRARSITLRRAETADAYRLWLWRNDEATRLASRNRAPVAWDDHLAWFRRALADPARAFFIGETNGWPVGVCRLDREGPAAEVNITVAPDFRRCGIGRAILGAIEEEARATSLRWLIAEIRWSNRASLKIFWLEGYRLRSLRWGFVTLRKRL
jgi:UDP-2,4-diacetamido-2,4,6-trideoxy-beta-L-altropyranose hydrolase